MNRVGVLLLTPLMRLSQVKIGDIAPNRTSAALAARLSYGIDNGFA